MSTKNHQQIIKSLLDGWKFTRRQTSELLESLADKDLNFTPKGSPKFKDLQSQFACLGATQLAYTRMLEEKKTFISKYFEPFKKELIKLRKKSELRKKLEKIDKEFQKTILKSKDGDCFDWGDVKTPVWRIITLLQEHERLHHGQLISYFTLAGFKFPAGFKQTWDL